jgi:AcrR family transcriptional regulator
MSLNYQLCPVIAKTASGRPKGASAKIVGLESPDRRAQILDAAVSVFFRYGLNKTTMDDVARAAGLSRQGLYLQFSSKDVLFEAAVRHAVVGAVTDAKAALRGDAPVVERVLNAFVAYSSLHFTHLSSTEHLNELMATATSLCGDAIADANADFVAAVARAVKDFAGNGASAKDLATTLVAAAAGLKRDAKGRDAYLAGMKSVIRVVLRESP